jgi:quercetin dioxygenase-like cupin family protein
MTIHLVCLGAVGMLALVCGMLVGDAEAGAGGHDDEHVIVKPANLKWGPAPPSLPAGAMLVTLSGNPKKAGAAFTARIKLPAGYQVPPHWHPVDESITVLEGTLLLGRGEKLDLQKAEQLPTGSYTLLPQGMRRFFAANGETIIQVHGLGPLEINYVNPADDPRKKK